MGARSREERMKVQELVCMACYHSWQGPLDIWEYAGCPECHAAGVEEQTGFVNVQTRQERDEFLKWWEHGS